ncbi:MAG: tetratricopeptide repeat protein, partial [Actinomycetota bacterium]|nr:tetratricopeptide repeat protein [Actinomycetota bacterium]
ARLRVVPEDWRSYASLGLAYVQEARITADPSYYPKAQGVLQRSLALDSADNFEAMVGMGALGLARHDFAGALTWGERARKLNPYNGNVYGVIGDAEVELGHYDDAFATFQKMVNTLPDTASYARVSYARELQGDVSGAIQAMKAALDAAGTAEDGAWASYQLGELYFNSGHLGAAEKEYAQGAKLSTTYVPPLAGLAKVEWARGETARAIRDYRAVVSRYPSPEYVIALGDLYAISGNKAQADQQYQLVRVEEQLFRANGVNVDLEVSLFECDHGDPQAGLEQARAEWDRRHSIHVADALGWALYKNGDYRQAAHYSSVALHLGTKSALFLFHAGMIQLKLGDRPQARMFLGRAIATNPHFSILYADEAARTLAKLGGS